VAAARDEEEAPMVVEPPSWTGGAVGATAATQSEVDRAADIELFGSSGASKSDGSGSGSSSSGSSSSSFSSSRSSRSSSSGSDNEPPSLTGRAAAPAFAPPSPALAAALRANERRSESKKPLKSLHKARCVVDCDDDANHSGESSSGSSEALFGGRGRDRRPRPLPSSSVASTYPWLHLVRVEALWDPVRDRVEHRNVTDHY
jgi:hypothetical protein